MYFIRVNRSFSEHLPGGICPTRNHPISADTGVSESFAVEFCADKRKKNFLKAVCWQPTGREDGSFDNLDIKTGVFLSNLQLYVGELEGLRTEVLTILTLNRGVFAKLAAVCS